MVWCKCEYTFNVLLYALSLLILGTHVFGTGLFGLLFWVKLISHSILVSILILRLGSILFIHFDHCTLYRYPFWVGNHLYCTNYWLIHTTQDFEVASPWFKYPSVQLLCINTSKRYWGNIGPISHAILAQYCIQYWRNIAEGYVLSILCQYWRQYWCNIGDHIAPILAPMIKLVPILEQYITNIAPMFLHAEILAQYCIQYWRNIAEGYVLPILYQYWCIIGDHIAPILAI